MTVLVRRVRADEWVAVRELRLQALEDPAASIAFLDTRENAGLRDDAFWQARAAGAADTDAVAQFVAVVGESWIGSVSVRRLEAGSTDGHGRTQDRSRGDVVGVYVHPDHRGTGVIDELFAAAAAWSRGYGDDRLVLEVHADNARAQSAYRRAGFRPTGLRFVGPIGDEFEMALGLDQSGSVPS